MRQIILCSLCGSVIKGDYEQLKDKETHCVKYDRQCELIVKQVK